MLWLLLLLPAALLVLLPLMVMLEQFTDRARPLRRDPNDAGGTRRNRS